jgi:OmpA-OmpF porin, OOP family
MTLSKQTLRNWPMAALALAISCTVSAQTAGTTDGSSTPSSAGQSLTPNPLQNQGTGTTSTMGTTGTTGTTSTTGTTGTMGTTGTAGTTGTTATPGGSGSMDRTTGATGTMGTTGTASGYQSGSTATGGSMMGRPMYSQGEGNYSLIPYSTGGYVGVNIGTPDYNNACATGFRCSNNTTAYKLYTGGMFNEYVGAELGYVNMGRAHRAGGRTEAHGINLSVVGRVPLGGFNLFGKVGTTYGRTEVSASPLAVTTSTGKEKGWGGSYGVGVGFDLTPASAIVLEWERHDFRFSGTGKQNIDTTMLGYVHRF